MWSKTVTLLCLIALIEARPQGDTFGFQNENGGIFLKGNQDAFSVMGKQKFWENDGGRSYIDATAQYNKNHGISGVGIGMGRHSPGGSIGTNVEFPSGTGDPKFHVGLEVKF